MADKNRKVNYAIPLLQYHPCPCLGSNYNSARFLVLHPGLHWIVKLEHIYYGKSIKLIVSVNEKKLNSWTPPIWTWLFQIPCYLKLKISSLADLFFSNLLSVISISRYFDLLFTSTEGSKQQGSTVRLEGQWHPNFKTVENSWKSRKGVGWKCQKER